MIMIHNEYTYMIRGPGFYLYYYSYLSITTYMKFTVYTLLQLPRTLLLVR